MPATTPLSTVVELVGANVGTVGRRAAVITASSGLVVSMGVTVADAAPVTAATEADPVTASQPALDAATLAALEVAATAAAAPVVQVAPDAAASLARPSLSAATPPPPPPPPVRTAPAASRSTTRTAVATAATTETAEVSAAPVDAEGIRGQIIATANRYLGIPYRYGGTTPAGFDCSGFTGYVFAQVGISLPRTSGSQAGAGTRVSRAEAQPGDLVHMPGHIGIYAGGNMMIDSPSSGGVTSLREIWSSSATFIRVI